MPRKGLTVEERAAKRAAKAEAIRAEREANKRDVRAEIFLLASRIPPHVREGGVDTVREWKEALDIAVSAAVHPSISVARLQAALGVLQRRVDPLRCANLRD